MLEKPNQTNPNIHPKKNGQSLLRNHLGEQILTSVGEPGKEFLMLLYFEGIAQLSQWP